jgi:hypothetical protein
MAIQLSLILLVFSLRFFSFVHKLLLLSINI